MIILNISKNRQKMIKKLLLSLIFIIALNTVDGQTNAYHTFPDSFYWRVDMHCQFVQTNCNEFYYYNYHFEGDTIIKGASYRKLMRDSVILVGIGGPPCLLYPWASFTGYMGALKEDSILNKIFFIWAESLITDSLLYDYNLVVGDTLKGRLVGNCKMIISSVDSILIGNQFRKKWNFNTCNEGPGYIIQGIGSDNGLIEQINSEGFCVSSLVCVRNITSTLFMSNNPSTYGCHIISSVLETKRSQNSINIYPNPFSFETTIKSDRFLKDATIIVYNSHGQIVKEINNISGLSTTLFRNDLPCGLYFLLLREADKMFVKKIVITE